MNLKTTLSKLKATDERTRRKRIVIAISAGAATLVGLTLLTFMLTTPPKQEEVAPEQATTTETKQETKTSSEDVPTIAEALDAAVRAHDRATIVCYDEHVEGFLIQYPHKAPDGNVQYFEGWYYLKYSQMWKTQNGIWFMKDFDSSEYLKVYPDVTGLNCKRT